MYMDIANHCEFLMNQLDGNDLIPACLRWIDMTIDKWESFGDGF